MKKGEASLLSGQRPPSRLRRRRGRARGGNRRRQLHLFFSAAALAARRGCFFGHLVLEGLLVPTERGGGGGGSVNIKHSRAELNDRGTHRPPCTPTHERDSAATKNDSISNAIVISSPSPLPSPMTRPPSPAGGSGGPGGEGGGQSQWALCLLGRPARSHGDVLDVGSANAIKSNIPGSETTPQHPI